MLSKDERDLILILSENKSLTYQEIMKKLNWEYARVSRNVLWLQNKNLIKTDEKIVKKFILTDIGRKVLINGLPERKLFNYLGDKKQIFISAIPKVLNLSQKEVNVAVGSLKKYGIIKIRKEDNRKIVTLIKSDDKEIRHCEDLLKKINQGDNKVDNSKIKDLIKRNLIKSETDKNIEIFLTPLGEEVKEEIKKEGDFDVIEVLTKEIIEKEIWRNKKFRRYDLKALVPAVSGGREHPLYWVIDIVREIFVGMGFEEIEGDWIETAFWNMDSMFIPQDHPARDVQDTFYLSGEGRLPSRELVQKVKKVQENGWDTGSEGYNIKWSEKEARKLVLRSHTTAVTYRMFAKGIKLPMKVFCIGRVFRNEKPDKLHLPEFHQIEGFVAAENLNLRHLMGYLSEFYKLMGITKIKFKPTYNPYTEPSMEVFAYHPKLNKWIEIANSGIFRPEARRPYNICVNVVAWGLALERLASLLYETTSIRDLLGHECDLEFIRKYPYKEIKL